MVKNVLNLLRFKVGAKCRLNAFLLHAESFCSTLKLNMFFPLSNSRTSVL